MHLTKCISILFVILIGSTTIAYGQHFGPLTDRFETLEQNSVTSLESLGDTLWIGPGLNRIAESSGNIFVPKRADSVFNARGRVFSMQLAPDTVWAGLGYTDSNTDDPVQTGMGFTNSYDGGENWNFVPFPLDPVPDSDCDANSVGPPCDIEFEYGGETYIRTRITVSQQSPPFEIDFRGDTLFAAAWASGIMRSTDGGENWERIILPPSTRTSLKTDETYNWRSETGTGETVNRYDPRSDNNLLGFGLMIDSQDRVWVGTAAGLNISENALTAPADQIEWKRIPAGSGQDELPGNWIVSIREDPQSGRVWLTTWSATSSGDDQFGLACTDDGGETFSRHLIGERVNDIGFFNGKVFAAANRGLFISGDEGSTWRRQGQIISSSSYIKSGAEYYALSATGSQMWVGTSDGLASTADGGRTWDITRVDVPLSGGNIYQPDAPSVQTYAYPNPYSPRVHGTIRIKYEAESTGSSQLRIFDSAMNPVYRSDNEQVTGAGSYEFSWDGKDNQGRFVSNGPYIYIIQHDGRQIDGKILLVE